MGRLVGRAERKVDVELMKPKGEEQAHLAKCVRNMRSFNNKPGPP